MSIHEITAPAVHLDDRPSSSLVNTRRRRDELKVLGLPLGILGVLLILAVTLGAAPRL